MSKTKQQTSWGAATRAAAAFAVDQVLSAGRSLDHALVEAANEQLPDRDRAQVAALAYGALRWHHRHQLLIDALLDRPLRARDKILEALLSVGLFQLFDARQPNYAAVSATVEATRRLGKPRAAGLVNASLRRFLREQNALLSQALSHDQGRYSHPQWMIDRIREDWADAGLQLMPFALVKPPMWIRVNAQRIDIQSYQARLLQHAGVESTTLAGFTDALCLAKPMSVDALPGFAAGDVSVQDAAPQLAAELLGVEPGMQVLDACAAPGGKTGHLLERCAGPISLTAIDINADRNARVRQNLERLGFSANVVTGDISSPEVWQQNGLDSVAFDRILLDAPCSATGVIRRHPDIKFLRRPDDVRAFATRQRLMLDRLWEKLKPGGQLLYATCSIFKEENQDVVTAFLERQDDASEQRPLSGPAAALAQQDAGPGYQYLPGPANTDGFYYALMAKSA